MYLLDTDICIYIIKHKPAAVLDTLKKKRDRNIFISSITVAELEYGVVKSSYPEKNKLALIEFLSYFEIIDFNDKDAVEFGKIKTRLEKIGRIIGPMDLLISAQASARNFVLITNNVREFERIEDLRIENWAE